MSASLDLAGATYTISADTTETFYQITDSSTLHNGILVIEEGAVLQFDDIAGAGFDSAATAITITVTGSADNPAEIRSAETLPHNAWSMPAITTTMTVTRCRIKGQTGAETAALWVFNNVKWGEDYYCEVDDVRDITNAPASGITAVSAAAIERFIKDAVDEIDERSGRTWTEQTATDEIYEWSGQRSLKLKNYPVTGITSLAYRTGDGTWETMTEGSEHDYYLSDDGKRLGFVELIESPYYETEAVKITYTHGETPVPYKIRKLASKMAAIQTFRAMRGKGTKANYADEIKALESETDKLLTALGSNIEICVPQPTGNRRWGRGIY